MGKPQGKVRFAQHPGLEDLSFERLSGFRCGECRVGFLVPVGKTLLDRETAESKAHADHEAWEPEWTRWRVAWELHCSNPACKDAAVLVGVARRNDIQGNDPDEEMSCDRVFNVRLIDPAPALLEIPADVPDPIRREVRRAESLLWIDPGSSMNATRSAVEAVLDEFKVARRTGGRKPRRLSLNERIDRAPDRIARSKPKLHATRWLGNAGSHSDKKEVSCHDAMDALRIIERLLSEAFDKSVAAIERLAREVQRRKGPVKR